MRGRSVMTGLHKARVGPLCARVFFYFIWLLINADKQKERHTERYSHLEAPSRAQAAGRE